MVLVSPPLPSLSPGVVSLYHATDPLLCDLPILVYHGPSTTTNTTLNSARIQIHVFSAAGFHSYPRITVSPNSPLYAAVKHLPSEQQGDEVCRGLAIGLLKYFGDLSEVVKARFAGPSVPGRGRHGGQTPAMFDEMHAGDLASRMTKVRNAADVTRDLQAAFAERSLPSIDVDVVLPAGSIHHADQEPSSADESICVEIDHQYGEHASLVGLFGECAFLPTSRLRRAPSKPTSLNRSKSLSKSQKELLRREMCELVDTEERYVEKVRVLTEDVAAGFRQTARTPRGEDSDPGQEALQTLFPSSLDEILDVNSRFLEGLRVVLDETEQGAMADIEADVSPESLTSRAGRRARGADAIGALAVSKVLLTWFPLFADSYTRYMRASASFPAKLSGFSRDPTSSFSQRVRQIGEQRLRSLLIEPVQRLPRYTLFIDNIVNTLPASHPALSSLLKSRDIITDICALDSDSADHSQTVNRLRPIIGSWPSNFEPRGRLICAADVVGLLPPFRTERSGSDATGIILLFADCLVLVSKTANSSLSARGVMGEVDRPSAGVMAASLAVTTSGQVMQRGLIYQETLPLDTVRLSESNASRVVWVTRSEGAGAADGSTQTHASHRVAAGVCAYQLLGAYEGKAGRWLEEVAKARIEARFSEGERDADRWEMRSVHDKDKELTVFAAVFEQAEGQQLVKGRGLPSLIQIVLDGHDRGRGSSTAVGTNGIEIVLSVNRVDDETYRLGTDVVNGHFMVEDVSSVDLETVLFRRLADSLYQQHLPRNANLTASLLSLNEMILRSLSIQGEGEPVRNRTFRPPSPVKMLSSFFSGQSSRDNTSPVKQRHPTLGHTPKISALGRKPSRAEPQKSFAGERDWSKAAALVTDNEARPMVDSILSLEETLQTYVQAIYARRGNVVGRVIRARALADEVTVNDLYNSLLEDPSRRHLAAESTVDVLFAAFEKFLKLAWDDKMGPVITTELLGAMLSKSDSMFPADFAVSFTTTLEELAPQNRRSFAAIMKLLAELLDASGNDGDRGVLTATFAELLAGKADPHAYISLLDRLVEDYDRLFEEQVHFGVSGRTTPMAGSVSSAQQARSINTGSISSNASSLKKRFGFPGLTRSDSKPESESRVGSVWRNLGRTAGRSPNAGDSAPSSFSKASSLVRSRSTDIDGRLRTPRSRPVSQDRPITLGAFSFESPQRPNSSHVRTPTGTPLTAGLTPGRTPESTQPRKKKRRSSLSDLKARRDSTASLSRSSPEPARRLEPTTPTSRYDPPRTPSPTKYRAPYPPVKAPRSTPKEMIMPRGTLSERPYNIQAPDEVNITEHHRSVKPSATAKAAGSAIPTLSRGGSPLREKAKSSPTGALTRRTTASQPGSPQKLRMQSPQKLRERLQSEQASLHTLDAGLQAELSQLGRDLSQLSRTSSKSSPTRPTVQSQLQHLTATVPPQIAALRTTLTALSTDLSTTVASLERRIQRLDQLHREANAENEALYERFNHELGKIARAGAKKKRGVGAESDEADGAVEEMLLQRLDERDKEVRTLRAERAQAWRRDALREVVSGAAVGDPSGAAVGDPSGHTAR